MQLVIVESPAKAKTIEKFLGKDFKVASSIGHIRNLNKSGKDRMGIDIENDFAPDFEIDVDKKKIIQQLKKEVKQSSQIWLATDEDREGEAIAWHLFEALNLEKKIVKRIVFNEITQSAIQKAIENPRFIDENLVKAQQTRQIIDRIVGYKLSPVLWKKISGAKSAGRVQSPAMKLVVDREKQIQSFTPEENLDIELQLANQNNQFAQFKCQIPFEGDEKTTKLLNDLINDNFKVQSVESKPGIKKPSAPFITSTLQQEASNRLGYSVKRTMSLAQDLYRKGYISYMRTDSYFLSNDALESAKKVIYSQFGKDDYEKTTYRTKSRSAQEAHEAIRPTNFELKHLANENEDLSKLYALIYKRTIASQMKPAKIKKLEIKVGSEATNLVFSAGAESIEYLGFLKVYENQSNQSNPQFLNFVESEILTLKNLYAKQSFSKPKPRYTEASLVKKLESLEIGRPSTYATMVTTIQDRGYVVKGNNQSTVTHFSSWSLVEQKLNYEKKQQVTEADKSKLYPTDIAFILSDFLDNHFSSVINYDFTAELEDEFDKIAAGNQSHLLTLKNFYQNFKKNIDLAEKIERSEVNQEKILGIDPKTGKKISARMGRFGPFAQLHGKDENEKPVFASLRDNITLQNITLDDALELFKLPRIVGKTEQGDEIKANHGRFGAYLQYKNKFVSLKDIDPLSVDLQTALNLIAEKEKKDSEMVIKSFENSEIQILNGRFGPYITNGKKRGKGQINVTIAKVFEGVNPKDLSLEKCESALKEKQKNPFKRTKKTTRKS